MSGLARVLNLVLVAAVSTDRALSTAQQSKVGQLLWWVGTHLASVLLLEALMLESYQDIPDVSERRFTRSHCHKHPFVLTTTVFGQELGGLPEPCLVLHDAWAMWTPLFSRQSVSPVLCPGLQLD